MGEEVKIEVIRTTQNSLSKHIKKPPLTEKLLRKPPFRYLHDITTAVMRETGFLQGLFTQEELNPENIKDRDAKIAFLEKLIAAVSLSTGVNITARPNKIVAGLDVAKTNELLQAIAKALDKKIDSSKAVEQVLNKKSKGVNQQKKENVKDKNAKESKTNEVARLRESRNTDTLKRKTKDKTKIVEKPESRKSKPNKEISPTKNAKVAVIEESTKNVVTDIQKDNQDTHSDPPKFKEVEQPISENVPETVHHDPEPKHDVKPPPSSPKQAKDPSENKENKGDVISNTENLSNSENKQDFQQVSKDLNELTPDANIIDISKPDEELKRPQSARAVHRKKVPKKQHASEVINTTEESKGEHLSSGKSPVELKETVNVDKKPVHSEISQSEGVGLVAKESKRPRTAARPASARPGAPRVRDRGTILLNEQDNKDTSEPVNVIVDSKDLPKDDDETLVMVEASTNEVVVDQVVDESHLLSGDQGHLVSQILETQKELEENTNIENAAESLQKVDISWASGRQEAVAKEVEKLRSAIQSLTRAVNPLGKLIDFLQEDIDSMQTELENWVTTNQELTKQLHAEERLTEECIEPLTRQLEDIEQLIAEQIEETSVVKAVIIRNDERIAKLLKTSISHLPG